MIESTREGFATNSSSSHFIIIPKRGKATLKDKKALVEYPVLTPEYGWEPFLLTSFREKFRYGVTQLYTQLRITSHPFTALKTVQGLFPDYFSIGDPEKNASELLEWAGVDHASHWGFPRYIKNEYSWFRREESGINLEFAQEFIRGLAYNSEIAIGGGSDNVDTPDKFRESVEGQGKIIPVWDVFPTEHRGHLYVTKKSDHLWVVFNRRTGAKYRINTFFPGFEVYHSYSLDPVSKCGPELVDLKITSYCNVGCPFCYQDSNEEGTHANSEKIVSYVEQLASLGLFEVALGGGDPTSHPDFAVLLAKIRKLGVVPSFSSATLSWAEDEEKFESVALNAGGFALSTQSPDDILPLSNVAERITEYREALRDRMYALERSTPFNCIDVKEYEEWNVSTVSPTIHYVMGLNPVSNLIEMLTQLQNGDFRYMHNYSIVLLGYKPFGRAEGTDPPYPYEDWFSQVHAWRKKVNKKQHLHFGIAIDTSLAHQTKEYEKFWHSPYKFSEHIDPIRYEVREGVTSCYIDAVDSVVSESSYHNEKFRFSSEHGDKSSFSLIEAINRAMGRYT